MNNYFIQRVQIEGGFLDGFDLNLKNGLNTIIGARGTGKSTFIELIRFGLNIQGLTNDSNNKSMNHALSVLKDGQVIITLSNNEEDNITITRSSTSDYIMDFPSKINKPLIFSQTEIENIGLLSSGRLNIIDNFIEDINLLKEKELNIIAKINTISKELYSVTEETDNIEEKTLPLKSKQENLIVLESQLNFFSDFSEELSNKSSEIDKLMNEHTKEMYKLNYIKNFHEKETAWINNIKEIALFSPEIEIWREIEINPIENILNEKNKITQNILELIEIHQKNCNIAKDKIHKLEDNISIIKQKSQLLRKEIDGFKEGFGEISRKIQNLKNEINLLEKLKFNIKDNNEKIRNLQKERNILLDILEDIRLKKSSYREQVCNKITNALSPKINIGIEFSSQTDDYINVLTKGFKGSGIKYNDIISVIAESIPPRELVNIIENNNIEDFTSLIEISKNRAANLINSLKNSIQDIATVLLEDKIYFYLNDGTESKDFNELSTGQRCTVILPIILEHNDTILIIDQPEDHIDNAFIVDTLINSIKRRKNDGQTIITTHNANLPVLGEAEVVAHLESDGRRGFIKSFGELNEINIINAISNVMEGGKKAFIYRSNFYGI